MSTCSFIRLFTLVSCSILAFVANIRFWWVSCRSFFSWSLRPAYLAANIFIPCSLSVWFEDCIMFSSLANLLLYSLFSEAAWNFFFSFSSYCFEAFFSASICSPSCLYSLTLAWRLIAYPATVASLSAVSLFAKSSDALAISACCFSTKVISLRSLSITVWIACILSYFATRSSSTRCASTTWPNMSFPSLDIDIIYARSCLSTSSLCSGLLSL